MNKITLQQNDNMKDLENNLRITGTCFPDEALPLILPLQLLGKYVLCLFFKLRSSTSGYSFESFRRSLRRHVFFLLLNLALFFAQVEDRNTRRKYVVNMNLNTRITNLYEANFSFPKYPIFSVNEPSDHTVFFHVCFKIK